MKPTRWRHKAPNTWIRDAGRPLQLKVVQSVHVDGTNAGCSAYVLCATGIVWQAVACCQTVRGAKCIATSAVLRIARDINTTMIGGSV